MTSSGRSPNGSGHSAKPAPVSSVAAQRASVPNAFAALKANITDDPEYAWAWHCNLAMPMVDAIGVTRQQANQAAALIMCQMFDYDITAHPNYDCGKSGAQAYFEMRIQAERDEDAEQVSA